MSVVEMQSGSRNRLFWQLQCLGWGGAMILTIGIGGFIYSPLSEAIWLGVFRSVFGLVATAFLLRPLLRHLWTREKRSLVLSLLLVVVACGLLGYLDTEVATRFAQVLPVDLDKPVVRPFLAASAVLRGILYGFWSLLYFGVRYWIEARERELRLARAEAEARASELQTLRAQVNPHFLFNALNSILAESGRPESVRRITLALAEYLRFSLQQKKDVAKLGVELAALENYLQVEKFRFEDDFDYYIHTDTAAPQTTAPVALVQPLLENAIKFGQRSSIRPLRVSTRAEVENGVLTVAVANSGEWCEEKSPTRTGLANLRRRLALLYGDRTSLTIEKRPAEVQVVVKLPADSSPS